MGFRKDEPSFTKAGKEESSRTRDLIVHLHGLPLQIIGPSDSDDSSRPIELTPGAMLDHMPMT